MGAGTRQLPLDSSRSVQVLHEDDSLSARGVACERDFQVKHEASGNTTTYLHKDGEVIYLPCPMNQENFHSVPKRKKIEGCRISLTFREIV